MTRSVIRSPRSRRAKEPWYILTNDMSSSRTKIVRIYYHRFEIEETFKDLKHVLELRRTRLNRPNSLKAILWLTFLGIAVLYCVTKPTKQQVKRQHPKKRISWMRTAMEQLHQAVGLVLWVKGEVWVVQLSDHGSFQMESVLLFEGTGTHYKVEKAKK
jgi:hypothetical protein